MAEQIKVPDFAVVGHPNEGKSSVLSTLAEDDSVRISSVPGETIECRRFPVVIDKKEIIAFVDTPGFQNPRKVLQILKGYGEEETNPFDRIVAEYKDDPALHDDCELLGPIVDGAGIIYVVDGSRPLRNVDRAEMEILRLTGRPRMAIINSKEEIHNFEKQWRDAFRKNFNAVRIFNAHRATYRERIELLQALKHIEQDWLLPLEEVIEAFTLDWQQRSELVADTICSLLRHCLAYRLKEKVGQGGDENKLREKLYARYTSHIAGEEEKSHQRIRKLYKHNIFQLSLPPQSILEHELFHEKTWQILGLDKKQLIMAGAVSGAAIGAGLDLAVAGSSLALFSAIGGLAGAVATGLGGKELLGKKKIFGFDTSREEIQVGPNTNLQFLFILIDRALLYYEHVINWAHGKREPVSENDQSATFAAGYTRKWNRHDREVGRKYFDALIKNKPVQEEETALRAVILTELGNISNSDARGARQ